MSSLKQWWSTRKGLVFFALSMAVAVGLTACAKGFRLDQTKSKATGQATIPVNTNALIQTADGLIVSPFVDLAMAASKDVADIVKAPANRGKISAQTTVGFAITQLDPQGVSSAKDSVLYVNVTVQGADGRKAAALVVVNKAELAVFPSNDGNIHIEGYWTIERQGQYPYYIGMQSIVKPMGNGVLNLQGNLLADFTGQGAQTLSSFDQNICTLVVDPWPWASQFYEEGTFAGCPAGE